MLVAFLVGLSLARIAIVDVSWLVLGFGVSGLFWLSKLRQARLAALLFISLCIGWWRGSLVANQLHIYQELEYQKVSLSGRVESDSIYDDHSQLSFDLSHIVVNQPLHQPLLGKIAVSGYGATMIYRGDDVTISGKLYPSRGSHQAHISFAAVYVDSRDHSALNRLRLKFLAGMQSALPEPLASFGLGLLIGQRSTLPIGLSQQLAIVGLTHLIAVSGYNLTILMRVVRRLAGQRSKYQTSVLSLLLICLFLHQRFLRLHEL